MQQYLVKCPNADILGIHPKCHNNLSQHVFSSCNQTRLPDAMYSCSEIYCYFLVLHCAPMAPSAHWHHHIWQSNMQNLHMHMANMTSPQNTWPTCNTSSLQPNKDPPTVGLPVPIGIWSLTWPLPTAPHQTTSIKVPGHSRCLDFFLEHFLSGLFCPDYFF